MKASPFLAAVLNSTIFSLLLAQTPPQSPPQPKPGEDEVVRVSTNLVQIDAVVTDKDGKQVTDLRAEDFEILEDNHPQQISAFSYVSTDSSVAGSAAKPLPAAPIKNAPPLPSTAPRPDQVRRTIVFVVDDLALSLQSFNAVRSGLKKFVDEQMRPDDLVAIIRTGGGAAALQRLTYDKRQLYAAIENARWRIGYGNRAGLRLFDENVIPLPKAEADERRISQQGSVMALENIVRSLRVLPGRKSVLFFSDRFETVLSPGDLEIGAAKTPTPGQPPGAAASAERDPTDYPDLIGGLVRASSQASAVIYTVDARGLVYTGPTAVDSSPTGNMVKGDPAAELVSGSWLTGMLDQRSATLLATQQSLKDLAHQTGGIAIINNNDIGKGIGRIMDDLKGYYLVGYRPSDTTFARRNGRIPYHAITLRLKRPGLHIRSRTGFYGVPDEARQAVGPRSRAEQLVASLESPFAAGEVRLRLTTLFGNVPQTSFVRTLLHIDARDLTFKDQPDGWHQADFDVLASSYGENGLIADYLARSEKIRARGKTYANLLRYGLNYNLLVPIKKPGPYQLRAAVRDSATDRIGSAYQFIEVPELKKGRLALSGIALSGAVLDLASLSSDSAVYNATVQEGESAQPTPAVRRFKAGTLMDYGYVVYNALPGPKSTLPDLRAEVRLFHEGELVTSQAEPAIDTGRLQLDLKRLSSKGRLRLSDQLIHGQYVLQIVVTDPRAKEKYATASQWIDFEIVK
jgi:VWFA-related protein